MIAAKFWRTHGPSQLAWSEGWWPPDTLSTFFKLTGGTEFLIMTGHDDSTINIVVVIIIIIRLFVGQLEGHLVCKKSALVSQSCF